MYAMTAFDEMRFRGALIGLAAGDAVGTTVEFKSRGTFPPVTDLIGGGPFDLEPGQWTDDTSMALCLAESLIVCGGFDALDQIRRYYRWCHDGHFSSTGACFDIGGTVAKALIRFDETGEPFSGDDDAATAGNGSLMRLAPVPMYFAADPATAINLAGESSRTTHQAPTTIDACRYYGALLVGALHGESKSSLLSPHYNPVDNLWKNHPLVSEIDAIAAGSFRKKSESEIESSGYVVHTLEAALWAFDRTDTFRDAILTAVNLGGDADTTAAVCGQLAGAFYGVADIPADWVEQLSMLETLTDFPRRLMPPH